MKEQFLEKALENYKAANILFQNGLYNSSANRAYYSAFQAALYVLLKNNYNPVIDHRNVQSIFNNELINKKKLFPSSCKKLLPDLQKNRNQADYKPSGISKKNALNQINMLKEFFKFILKEEFYENQL